MLNLQDVLNKLAQFRRETNTDEMKNDLERDYVNSITSIQEFLYEVIDDYKKSLKDIEATGLHPMMTEQIEVLASLLESVENIDATVRTIDHDVVLYVEFKDTAFKVKESKLSQYDELSNLLRVKIQERIRNYGANDVKNKVVDYFEENQADYYRVHLKLADVIADGRVVHKYNRGASFNGSANMKMHSVIHLIKERLESNGVTSDTRVAGIDVGNNNTTRVDAHERYLPNRVVFALSLIKGELEVVTISKLALAKMFCESGQMDFELLDYHKAIIEQTHKLTGRRCSGAFNISGESELAKRTRDTAATLEYFAMCAERGDTVDTVVDDMVGFMGFFSDGFSSNTGLLMPTDYGNRVLGALHPHIGSTGSFCYGNIASDLSIMLTEFNYMGLVLLMYEFLKTTNMGDAAGRRVERFPTTPMTATEYTTILKEKYDVLAFNSDLVLIDSDTEHRIRVADFVEEIDRAPDKQPLAKEVVDEAVQELLDDSHGVSTYKLPTGHMVLVLEDSDPFGLNAYATKQNIPEDILPDQNAQWHMIHGKLFKVKTTSDADIDKANIYLDTYGAYKELEATHGLSQTAEKIVVDPVAMLRKWYDEMWDIAEQPDNVFGRCIKREDALTVSGVAFDTRAQIKRAWTAAFDYVMGRLKDKNYTLNMRGINGDTITLSTLNEMMHTATGHTANYFTTYSTTRVNYTKDFKAFMDELGYPTSPRYLVGGAGEEPLTEIESVGGTVSDISRINMPSTEVSSVRFTLYKHYFPAYMYGAVPQTHMLDEGEEIYYLTELALLDLLKTGTTNRVLNSFSYKDLACVREDFTYEAFELADINLQAFNTSYAFTLRADGRVFLATDGMMLFSSVEDLEEKIEDNLRGKLLDYMGQYNRMFDGDEQTELIEGMFTEIMTEPYYTPFKGRADLRADGPLGLFSRLNHTAMTDEELLPHATKVYGADVDMLRLDDGGEMSDILKLIVESGSIFGHTHMSILFDDKLIGNIQNYTPVEPPRTGGAVAGRGGLYARGSAMVGNTKIPQLFTQYLANSAMDNSLEDTITILHDLRRVFQAIGLDDSELVYMRNEYIKYKVMQIIASSRNTSVFFAPTALPVLGFETSTIIQRFMTMYQLPQFMKSVFDDHMDTFKTSLCLDRTFTLGRGTNKMPNGMDAEMDRVRVMYGNNYGYGHIPRSGMPFFNTLRYLDLDSPRIHSPVLLSMAARAEKMAKAKKEELIELQKSLQEKGFSVVGFEPFKHEHFLIKDLEEANS